MVIASDLAAAGIKYLGTPYTQMDCQAFVEQCLNDCGLKINLTGSNAWFRKMTWRGTPEECKKLFGEIPVGAFLYIVEDVSEATPAKYRTDGLKDASHIGIFTGRGSGALHSSSTKGCVSESVFQGKTIRNGGWNMIGLWDQISYSDLINEKLKVSQVKSGGGEPMNEAETSYATVHAESGTTVKMRAKPSTSCATYWDVPIGTVVSVLGQEGAWSKIQYGDRVGYMVAGFLVLSRDGAPDAISQEQLLEKIETLQSLLKRAVEITSLIQDYLQKEDMQNGMG